MNKMAYPEYFDNENKDHKVKVRTDQMAVVVVLKLKMFTLFNCKLANIEYIYTII